MSDDQDDDGYGFTYEVPDEVTEDSKRNGFSGILEAVARLEGSPVHYEVLRGLGQCADGPLAAALKDFEFAHELEDRVCAVRARAERILWVDGDGVTGAIRRGKEAHGPDLPLSRRRELGGQQPEGSRCRKAHEVRTALLY